MTETKTFDPTRHLTSISGSSYLEVKWRLVWLRSEHPDAVIDTELAAGDPGRAVFKARVEIPGGGSATGWGSEDAASFGDYLEKAETKAIGRALAALGYGTQFCGDFEFGGVQGRVVDAPARLHAVEDARQGPRRVQRPEGKVTGPQWDLLRSLARDEELDERSLDDLAREQFGRPIRELTRGDASRLIDTLQERKQSRLSRTA